MAAFRSPKVDGEVRWGIIGCGDVTEKKSGPALQQAARSKLVAVMRRDVAKAEDYAKRHNVPKFYGDVDALLADEEVNAVYVATPPGSHLELALRVAAAGLPLYVEKPAARTAWECEAMARGAAIAAGKLGALKSVAYTFRKPAPPPGGATPWRLNAKASGGGLFLDVGSHAVDLLEFVLGEALADVAGSARGSPGEVERAVSLTFRAAGAAGEATWDFEADGDEDSLVIAGDALVARCPAVMNGVDVVYERPDGTEVARETFPAPSPVQGPLVQTVVDALLDGAACPSTAASS
ncbi:D-xylose 1-dehydrogenase [Aureococcus anophagefferens]|nr:D-xylose 1-dehydrogenase [Aureococcus anophagefferens]